MVYFLCCIHFFSSLWALLYVFSNKFPVAVNLTEVSFWSNTLLISSRNCASLFISSLSLMPRREIDFAESVSLSLGGSSCIILIGIISFDWHWVPEPLPPFFYQKTQKLFYFLSFNTIRSNSWSNHLFDCIWLLFLDHVWSGTSHSFSNKSEDLITY